MSITYKLKYTDRELAVFNLIENPDIRKSLMSIYTYMVLLNKRKNEQYEQLQLDILKKEPNKLSISFSQLYKAYSRKDKNISLTTLKERVSKLIELKLITLHKEKHVNSYSFANCDSTDLPTICPTTENPVPAVENTKVEETGESHKYLNPKAISDYEDIDSNNSSQAIHVPNQLPELDYEKYIEGEGKVTDLDMVISKAKGLFKALDVRSGWIKERVMSKLSKYYTNITIKHMESYICHAISDARRVYYSNWEASRRAENSNLRFNNFDPREYDYDSLEWGLLGWGNYEGEY